jgi:hypothetical protein
VSREGDLNHDCLLNGIDVQTFVDTLLAAIAVCF